MKVIDAFTGPHRFLSNFSDHPVRIGEIVYPTAEHAFAAAKTTDPDSIARILAAPTPGAAKRLGRGVELRPGWNSIRGGVMAKILHAKFTGNPELRAQLLATGEALLIEGNDWADDYWGRVRQPSMAALVGANVLGRSLMALRHQLAGHPEQRWVRAALTGHREYRISSSVQGWVREELVRVAVKLREEHGTLVGSTGLATGADLWWADACRDAGLDLWGYQPHPKQTERWSSAQRDHHARTIGQLTRHVLVGTEAADYMRCLNLRNQLLIGDAQVTVAVRDPNITRGGTVSALARHCPGSPVITIDVAHRTTTLANPYAPRKRRG